jgi:hypothetical protein
VQVGTSRASLVSEGADYPFTLAWPARRRLIASVDLLAQCSRSHVLIGRSVVTGSSSEEPTSHGITLSRHDVLEHRIRGGLPRYEPVRANRLPDKEFRYLRTVIVTAAVYRGLGLKLRPKANLSP